ncbi:MAG: hypothetical protein HC893_12895 [Chloroflexaceae bacterium]|nr:hypothetical protein [Chloroflexaceae bacterium]
MAILLPPAWLLWSIPVLLAALGWQIRDVVATDVGGQDDQRVVQGFYRREQGLTDTLQPYTYRWSEPEASLLLPARTLPGIVELRGSVPPDGTVVRLRLGTRVQVSLPPSSGVEAVRRYQFLWPDDTDAWGWVRVGISTIRPDQRVERRSLGMLIAGVTSRLG